MESEESLKERLQHLKKQIGKKQMFEEAVSSIKSLLIQIYPSASHSLQNSIYYVVCDVDTILQTRYYNTAPDFWLAGKQLFEEAERIVTDSSEREHLKFCIGRVRDHLHESEIHSHISEPSQTQAQTSTNSRYIFNGRHPTEEHVLVVVAPPPPPSPRSTWQVAHELLATLSQGQRENNSTSERASELMDELVNSMEEISGLQELEHTIQASLQQGMAAGLLRPPPASKQVVANLPCFTVTEENLASLGCETECAVCKENLVINDKMQELPCKHLFHPPCLKPWLDKHNSCPICRHELPTDNHAYESRKERERKAKEEGNGATSAVHGGESMRICAPHRCALPQPCCILGTLHLQYSSV